MYCACRTDSLIREECCPWHPEFSIGITRSCSLFPALRSSSRHEQTRRGEPSVFHSHSRVALHPSPLPTTSPFLILFITFSLPCLSEGQSMLAVGPLSTLPFSDALCLQSGGAVAQAHDSPVSQNNSGGKCVELGGEVSFWDWYRATHTHI